MRNQLYESMLQEIKENSPPQVFSEHMTEFLKQLLSWKGWNQKIKAAENVFVNFLNRKKANKNIRPDLEHLANLLRKKNWKASLSGLAHLISYTNSHNVKYTSLETKKRHIRSLNLQRLTWCTRNTLLIRWSQHVVAYQRELWIITKNPIFRVPYMIFITRNMKFYWCLFLFLFWGEKARDERSFPLNTNI